MKPGIVWIAEDLHTWPDVDVADLVRRGVDFRTLKAGDVMCWTGLFSAHWEADDGQKFREGPDDVSIEEAIAWGHSQAGVLMVRVGDGDLGGDADGYFSAGTRHPHPEIPVWPDDLTVAARPYTGSWTPAADGYTIP